MYKENCQFLAHKKGDKLQTEQFFTQNLSNDSEKRGEIFEFLHLIDNYNCHFINI